MKISVDTQQDSQAEIRKAIKLLMSLVGDKEVYTNEQPKQRNIFEDSPSSPAEPSGGDAFVNLFGDNSSSPADTQPKNTEQKSEIIETPKEKEKMDIVQMY